MKKSYGMQKAVRRDHRVFCGTEARRGGGGDGERRRNWGAKDAAKIEKTLSGMKKNEFYPVGRTRWSLGGFFKKGLQDQSVF